MIPSVYSEVEAYKREGRINADAAYKVLQVSEQRAQRTGMQKYIEYQLDCMACVDEVLPNFFKRGCSVDSFYGAMSLAIVRAKQWHQIENKDMQWYPVYHYMLECARLNLDNPRRGRNKVSDIIARNAGNRFPVGELNAILWVHYLHDLFDPTEESIKRAIEKVEKHYRLGAPYYLGRGRDAGAYYFHMEDYPLIEKLKEVPGFEYRSAFIRLWDSPPLSDPVPVEKMSDLDSYERGQIWFLDVHGSYAGRSWSCSYSPDAATLTTLYNPEVITYCTPVKCEVAC